ncbi:MAG: CoA ester lyase, partial [Acidimicrobiales bacterium]
DTEWHADDLAAAAAAGPDAVVVPKVDSVDDVRAIEAGLDTGGAPERTKIWAMLETPQATLRAEEIAASSERLTVLVLGTNDLAKELHAIQIPGREPLVPALSMCIIGARAAGKVIIDGVYNDIRDADGFHAECVQGRQLGFDGKTLIHPSQIDDANTIWAPSQDAIAEARDLIAAFEDGIAAGKGVVTFNGRMIENLHVANARRVLAQAEAIAALDGS